MGSGDTCHAHTSTATANTRVCCYTHTRYWVLHMYHQGCAVTHVPMGYAVTEPSPADGLLHMFTWHRCQPCAVQTLLPLKKAVVRAHSVIQLPVHNCFMTALLLFLDASATGRLSEDCLYQETCKLAEKFDAHCTNTMYDHLSK